MFVIYERPKDYPDHYVIRRWGGPGLQDRDYFQLGKTLEEARRFVPPHCIRFPRDPRDEPQIVESWI